MSIKVLIVDAEAEFRRLLMHHVTTHWPDADISEFDPGSGDCGPDSIANAKSDVVLLGSDQGERTGLEVLQQCTDLSACPPLIYLGADTEQQAAIECYASGFVERDKIRHDALVVRISGALASRPRAANTDQLFVGDARVGVHPLVKGYRYIRKLSMSTHSAVYLAQREQDDFKLVLKVLRQVPDVSDIIGAFERFLQEYEMIAAIVHPNIVRIYDLGVSDDHAHIAMEYLDGGDLKARIRRGVSADKAVEYVREIASALAQIHDRGILHRDLKPGNIMLRSDDSVALIDFGLAKHLRLQLEITGSGEIFGTPYYMSPEQGHAGAVDVRSDIYSLGVIFYELLTGRKPYQADSAMGIIYQHAQAQIPLLPRRFAEFQALLNMMLAKRPDDRLSSAVEIEKWL